MRLLFRILSAVVITVAVAVLILFLLPGQKIAQIAANQIESRTGRAVLFGGDVSFSFWPTLGIQANDVALANADWAGPEPLFTAGRLTIGLAARDLIGGRVRITEVSAVVPHFNLETRVDGTGNWEFETAPQTPDAATEGSGGTADGTLDFAIESVALSGASLTLRNASSDTPVSVRNVDLTLDWPDPSGTATLALTLRPYGAPLTLAGEVGSFGRFIAGEVVSVGMDVSAPQTRLRLDGRAALSGAFEGRATGEITQTDALLKALGQTALGLPRGLGREVVFAADATYTPDGRLALRDLTATLDSNALSGEADVVLQSPVQINAVLSGGDIDLTGLSSGGAQAPASTGAAGWSSDPIDASALAAFDGAVSLDFKSLTSSALTLGPSRIGIAAERSRAVISLSPAELFGGSVSGELVANNRDGLSMSADLDFSGILMQRALGQLADYDKLHGEAAGSLRLLAVGNTMQALVGSLDGDGDLRIGKGFFTGFDLEAIMKPEGGNGGSTVFDSLTAGFKITDGVLRNDDFLARLEQLSATGEGEVDIGAQMLDYTFTPTAFASAESSGLSVPVRLVGPWGDPDIRPDLSKLVQPKLEEVEQQAKDRLREKLSDELGRPVESAEDVNKALKERLEEEARKQLLQFLSGD